MANPLQSSFYDKTRCVPAASGLKLHEVDAFYVLLDILPRAGGINLKGSSQTCSLLSDMSTPCFAEDVAHKLRSGVQMLDPALASALISDTRTQVYVQVALATVLVFSAFTNIHREIKYLWSHPGCLVSLIYFATRYIGILSALISFAYTDMIHDTLVECISTTWIASMTAWISMTLFDYILLIRVLALYYGDRRVGIPLKVSFVVEAAGRLALQLHINTTSKSGVMTIPPNYGFCYKESNPYPVVFIMRWILPMVYGLALLALALHKARKMHSNIAGRSGLLRVLIIDHGIYYFFVIVCCLFRILTEQQIIKNWLALNLLSCFGSPVFLSVLGSQMLLRLKEAGDRRLTVVSDTLNASMGSSDSQFHNANKGKRLEVHIEQSSFSVSTASSTLEV